MVFSPIPVADTCLSPQIKYETLQPHLLHNLASVEDVPFLPVTEDHKEHRKVRVKSPEHYRLSILAQQEVCSFLGVISQESW